MATYKVSKPLPRMTDEEIKRLYLLSLQGKDDKLSPKCYSPWGRLEVQMQLPQPRS